MDILWQEGKDNTVHNEAVGLLFDINSGEIHLSAFGLKDPPIPEVDWACSPILGLLDCIGVTVNRNAGTVTFSNTVLEGFIGTSTQITLDGTLNFKPF
jgi:hypothetical protein